MFIFPFAVPLLLFLPLPFRFRSSFDNDLRSSKVHIHRRTSMRLLISFLSKSEPGQPSDESKQDSPNQTHSSSSPRFSPNSFATLLRFLNEILPLLSSSNSRKARRTSSIGSRASRY